MTERMRKRTDVFKKMDMTGGPHACWRFLGTPNNKGLAYVQYKGKKYLLHRFTYMLVHGDDAIPDGMVLRHTCDNGAAPICCGNPKHLVVGTHQQNMNDMKERDRHGVPATVVRAIRRIAATRNTTHEEIAELYGLKRQTVSDIINGKTHNHVKESPNVGEPEMSEVSQRDESS